MKNTEYNLDALNSVISSDASFEALLGLISDMGLEILDVRQS